MIEPFMVTTVIAGVTAIALGCERIVLKSRIHSHDWRVNALNEVIDGAHAQIGRLQQANAIYAAADDKRRAHLKAIAPSGARASNESRKGQRVKAVAKTMAAMPSLSMRPREEVVAGVHEARAAKSNAGVAAQ